MTKNAEYDKERSDYQYAVHIASN